MNRRTLIMGSGALAVASLSPMNAARADAEMISPDGRRMVRIADRWHLEDEIGPFGA